MPNLTLRLKTIASLVPSGARVCDVGTDHGYLAIELMSSKKAKKVIAADIKPSPLKNAAQNIEKCGVKGIELRLCDGLEGIDPDEIDTIVIAGMGGEVIAGILSRGISVTSKGNKTIILQPTTSPEHLRKFLYDNGFEIQKELPVYDNGKLYSVMSVAYTGNTCVMPNFFYYIGKIPTDDESGLLYIKKQLSRCRKCSDSLKSITEKHSDYLYYNGITNDIESYLKNNGFGE